MLIKKGTVPSVRSLQGLSPESLSARYPAGINTSVLYASYMPEVWSCINVIVHITNVMISIVIYIIVNVCLYGKRNVSGEFPVNSPALFFKDSLRLRYFF